MLVVSGTEPKTTWEFIEDTELVTPIPGRKGVFTGENALIAALRSLAQGRRKIYFTQGQGELSTSGPRDPLGWKSMGEAYRRLSERGYEVTSGPVKDIKDADVVVIARPTSPFKPSDLKALRKYLKGEGGKKGKLLVCLDVDVLDGKMVHTGLEPLLAEYNVKVNDDRLVSLQTREPLLVVAILHPESDNKIARTLRDTQFRFLDVRTVEPMPGDVPNTPYKVEQLLLIPSPKNFLALRETDLAANPYRVVEGLKRDTHLLMKRLPDHPLCIGVAVSKNRAMMPPGMPPASSKDEPVMVVIGDSTWLTDREVRAVEQNQLLFDTCVRWLR